MENPSFERREQPSQRIGTMTGDELLERIYKGQSLPQDPRFLPINEGDIFKYLFLSELTGVRGTQGKFYPFVESNGQIAGLAELEQKPRRKDTFWIKFLSIDPQYEDKGYASKLAKEMFQFAKSHNYTLETSSYSPEGLEKLKGLFNKLAAELSVNFIDTNEVIGQHR